MRSSRSPAAHSYAQHSAPDSAWLRHYCAALKADIPESPHIGRSWPVSDELAAALESLRVLLEYGSATNTLREAQMADKRFAPLYKTADQFISQANTLTESTDLATVAAGLRYAAARFAAFEASLQTDDLHRDKVEALDAYLNEFHAMLDVNLEQYIEQQLKT